MALLVVTATWSPLFPTSELPPPVMIVSLGPFLLGSKPCETSLLQDELSLTSVVVLEWVPPPMGVGIWLEREGGRGCRDCSLLVELRRAARGEAGGRGWRRTTETTLCVCSHILRNLRKLPENNNNEKSHLCYTAWKSPKMSQSIFAIWAFSSNFCPIKVGLSGNTVWLQASGSQKSPKLTIFDISE